MTSPFTPEQARAAAQVQAALDAGTGRVPDADLGPLFSLFAASVVNEALARACAAFLACDEGFGPALPLPVFATYPHDDPNADAAIDFAERWVTESGAGDIGLGRAAAAVWFRTRTRALPAVVALAAAAGLHQQCWQVALRCQAPLIAAGALAEAAAISGTGLAAAERCGDKRAIALLHLGCGAVARMTGRLDEAMRHYDAAMPIFQQAGNQQGRAGTLLARGAVYAMRRDLWTARQCQLAVLDTPGVPPVMNALALGDLGHNAMLAGDVGEAITCGNAALQVVDFAAKDAIRLVMEVNRDLAEAHLANGDLEAAKRHIADALRAAEATCDDLTFASVHVAVHLMAGTLALHQDDVATALREFSLALGVRSNSSAGLADLLEGIGAVALAGGDHPVAVAVMHAAVVQRRLDDVPFRTAETLAQLADAYGDDHGQQAAALRAEALALLQPFRDGPATKLRAQLAAA
jgi:tetratricopeptide (TPR) repeat protein